ncbi:hypothetical protein [Paracoccus liaowanqingii]|uniref:hypothetical protein n=1 Tax=Paracoccus liaowanqingii TaxID=2560053 RepID=UPI00159BDE6B|nr:hypothetical protein [Paracoccus liaowanqingii]
MREMLAFAADRIMELEVALPAGAAKGSGLARRTLIEGAWSCRMQARVCSKLLTRLEA